MFFVLIVQRLVLHGPADGLFNGIQHMRLHPIGIALAPVVGKRAAVLEDRDDQVGEVTAAQRHSSQKDLSWRKNLQQLYFFFRTKLVGNFLFSRFLQRVDALLLVLRNPAMVASATMPIRPVAGSGTEGVTDNRYPWSLLTLATIWTASLMPLAREVRVICERGQAVEVDRAGVARKPIHENVLLHGCRERRAHHHAIGQRYAGHQIPDAGAALIGHERVKARRIGVRGADNLAHILSACGR